MVCVSLAAVVLFVGLAEAGEHRGSQGTDGTMALAAETDGQAITGGCILESAERPEVPLLVSDEQAFGWLAITQESLGGQVSPAEDCIIVLSCTYVLREGIYVLVCTVVYHNC